MYQTTVVRFLILVCFVHSSVWGAEGSGTHGGGAFVCRDESGNVIRAELLDLWEAKQLKQMEIIKNVGENNADTTLILKAIRKLRNYGQIEMAESVEKLALWEQNQATNATSYIGNEVAIATPDDLNSVFIAKGNCKIEGVAAYNDRINTLYIDRHIFVKMSSVDRAALFVHEGVYRYLRDNFNVRESHTTRGITACLFSETPCPELNISEGVPETGLILKCESQIPVVQYNEQFVADTSYLLFRKIGSPETARIQMISIDLNKGAGAKLLPTRTYIDFSIRNSNYLYDRLNVPGQRSFGQMNLGNDKPLWVKSSDNGRLDFALPILINKFLSYESYYFANSCKVQRRE